MRCKEPSGASVEKCVTFLKIIEINRFISVTMEDSASFKQTRIQLLLKHLSTPTFKNVLNTDCLHRTGKSGGDWQLRGGE